MFEKDAEVTIMKKYPSNTTGYKNLVKEWKDGAEFGYNKAKEEELKRLYVQLHQ